MSEINEHNDQADSITDEVHVILDEIPTGRLPVVRAALLIGVGVIHALNGLAYEISQLPETPFETGPLADALTEALGAVADEVRSVGRTLDSPLPQGRRAS